MPCSFLQTHLIFCRFILKYFPFFSAIVFFLSLKFQLLIFNIQESKNLQIDHGSCIVIIFAYYFQDCFGIYGTYNLWIQSFISSFSIYIFSSLFSYPSVIVMCFSKTMNKSDEKLLLALFPKQKVSCWCWIFIRS